MLHKLRKHKKVLSILIIFVMAISLFAGCGSSPSGDNGMTGNGTASAGKEGTANSQQSTGAAGENEQAGTDSGAMGRYVETLSDISEYCSLPKGIARLDDGTVAIEDMYSLIVSKDNGETWSSENVEWQEKLLENTDYIVDITYGSDGTAGLIYTVKKDTSGEEQSEESNEDPDDFETDYECLIVKPDGTQIPVQIDYVEEDESPSHIWISKTGRIFVTTFRDTIYEVNEDGTAEKYLTLDNRPEQVQFVSNLMVIDDGRTDGLVLYDMEKGEYVTDDVLNNFIAENYEERGYGTMDVLDIFFFEGEDGALYIAGNKGLHRHVIGGSAIEQVIDGSLSSFSNPANLIMGMTPLPDKEFLVLFTGGKVVRYTYNPDVPTVPNERLKVYSLKENDTMRQAVNLYQITNPEVFVEYEVGIEAESSVTRDDALKKLNTEIMAGQGPDVLVLDNMPIDSYVEKNLLVDLSDCINEQELFGNIVDAFRTDEKIYTIPCEIQIPLIQGKEKYITEMKDLKGIADAVEAMRKDNPGKPLLKIYSERGIMRLLAMVCAPAWKTEEGELNKEAIKEFLIQSKRVYDAELEGIPEEYIVNYNESNKSFSSFFDGIRESSDYFRMADCITYLLGDSVVNVGTIYYPHGVCEQFSVNKVEGHENDAMALMEGMSRNVFIPKTLVGINAGSANIERAKEIIKVLLGSENQESLFYGLSVNKDALVKSFEVDEKNISEDGVFSYIGTSTGDGRYMDLAIYVMEPEQMNTLQGWIEGARTPYIEDTVLEEVVYTEGTSYMRGYKTLEETANEIEQNLAIYMSE